MSGENKEICWQDRLIVEQESIIAFLSTLSVEDQTEAFCRLTVEILHSLSDDNVVVGLGLLDVVRVNIYSELICGLKNEASSKDDDVH